MTTLHVLAANETIGGLSVSTSKLNLAEECIESLQCPIRPSKLRY